MGKTTAPKSTSEHNLQQGKTTQLICEIAENVNGPSQSVVDARARLSSQYVHPQTEEYLCVGKQSDPAKKGTYNGGPT